MNNINNISIVIPVYNEEESLNELYNEIKKYTSSFNLIEIIFVDDGSQDKSYSIMKKIADQDEIVKIIKFNKNHGKAEALSAGFNNSHGEIIITIDADLQDDPSEFTNLINKINEGWDVVSGWKKNRKDPVSKRWPSKIFNLVTQFFIGLKIHDFNCGIKAYKKHVVKGIYLYGGLHRYIPAIACQKGFSVTEIEVHHRHRKYGKTKYGGARYFHGFFDLLTVMFIGKYTTKPLHFFGLFGFIGSSIGILIEFYVLYLKYILGEPFQLHIALLIFGVLFIVLGIQFFSIGLLGELLVRANPERKNRIEIIYNKRNNK